MATALDSFASDFETTIASATPVRRAAMLRNMTALFADFAPRLGDAQVSAFDMVLLHLARETDTESRAELSRRLAAIANAPPELSRNLAFDLVASVAGPILERATSLTDDDIAAIARQRGQSHLMAITRRATLSARITDIVVARGDPEVIQSVARNGGASFSLDSYAQLVGKGIADPDLAASLKGRADFPAILQAKPAESVGEPSDTAIDYDSDSNGRIGTRPDDSLFTAEVFVGRQARRGDLDEATLIGWMNSGRETEALVGLARAAGVPSRVAIEAYRAPSYEPLLHLVRSVRFGWGLLKLFVSARTGREASQEDMHAMMEAFQALSVATAQKVVRATAAGEHSGPA